jgi:hypothetical protein
VVVVGGEGREQRMSACEAQEHRAKHGLRCSSGGCAHMLPVCFTLFCSASISGLSFAI